MGELLCVFKKIRLPGKTHVTATATKGATKATLDIDMDHKGGWLMKEVLALSLSGAQFETIIEGLNDYGRNEATGEMSREDFSRYVREEVNDPELASDLEKALEREYSLDPNDDWIVVY